MGKKSAFSLLELIVVMAIAAVILSLGITGLLALRNTTIVRQSVTEFIENVTTVRNNARNTVISGRSIGSTPRAEAETIAAVNELDYFAIRFVNNNYQQGTCSSESTQITCSFVEIDLLKDNPANVIVTPRTGSSGCDVIIFNLSTGKFRFGNLSENIAAFNNNEKCVYTFRNDVNGGTIIEVEGDSTLGKFLII